MPLELAHALKVEVNILWVLIVCKECTKFSQMECLCKHLNKSRDCALDQH